MPKRKQADVTDDEDKCDGEVGLKVWKRFHDNAHWNDNQIERLVQALESLPKKLRFIAFAGFNLDGEGKLIEWYGEGKDAKRLAMAQFRRKFDLLPVSDRMRIFNAVWEQFAVHVEAAWQFLKTAPFDVDFRSNCFRAPRNPELTLDSRFRWLTAFEEETRPYKREVLTPTWLAEWAGKTEFCQAAPILIAALKSEGQRSNEVFEILRRKVLQTQSVQELSGYVIDSLFGSDRSEGWELLEDLLTKKSPRDIRLGRWIVYHAASGHPKSFERILRAILDHGLHRNKGICVAVESWLHALGEFNVRQAETVRGFVIEILNFITSAPKRKKALASRDFERVYHALWATAFLDTLQAIEAAKKLLKNKDERIRFSAVWMLTQLPLSSACKAKCAAVTDRSLPVAMLAALGIRGMYRYRDCEAEIDPPIDEPQRTADLFEKLESLYARLPAKPQWIEPVNWPWSKRKTDRDEFALCMLEALDGRPESRMRPYLSDLDSQD
jgi:hypothetical protein